jgi:DNA repair protein RecN (Recombination protein N)
VLQHLKIENYALIKHMDIPFERGFIAITGETGAGKSIMLGALGLVLGQRADTSVLWDKEKKCIVEAEFLLDKSLISIFEDNDLDYSEHTILRREIAPNGKSRAFINDTPVQLNIMKDLAESLMDIHSQHNTLTLKNSLFQFSIVDAYINTYQEDLLGNYTSLYLKWKEISLELDNLEAKETEFQKEASYLQFLSDELTEANLTIGEKEELEQEVKLLNNAEEIKSSIFKSINLLDNEEGFCATNLIKEALSNLIKTKSILKDLEEIYNRLDSTFIEIRDIISELTKLDEAIVFSPEKLTLMQERLDLIYRLEKKHQVNSLEELMQIKEEIDNKLLVSSNINEKIEQLKTEQNNLFLKLSLLAKEITKQRKLSSKTIEKEILPLLLDMGMEQAVLKINITENKTLSINGENDIEFLFNANLGGELQPISKVISGGELSRLMLALKAIMSIKAEMPTIILDEIDSGVSGDIASKVGNIMKLMSKNHQIIAITHLAQIAAKADYHYKVSKNTTSNSTFSDMKLLSKEERILEIASIISKDKITQNAISMAKELLD